MFLKVPVIIIIRFGENVLGTKYINFRGGRGRVQVHLIFYSFIIHKGVKITRT